MIGMENDGFIYLVCERCHEFVLVCHCPDLVERLEELVRRKKFPHAAKQALSIIHRRIKERDATMQSFPE